MAKRSEEKKPKEILILENAYGIRIGQNLYEVDKEGLLVSLILDEQLPSLEPIVNLTHLKILSVAFGKISDVKPLIKLSNLETLFLEYNDISDISPLAELKNLQSLYIYNNSIIDISALSGLKKLISLHISHNRIEDISVLANMESLKDFDVRYNRIEKITRSIPDLPISFDDKPQKAALHLAGNAITEPPLEIVQQGKAAVVKYWEEKERTGARKLNEVRLILIGHGGAGKTNLVHHILDEPYNEQEHQTHGILQTQWKFKKEGEDIGVNIWDFGGQQVQHAVHKLFLTAGCMYVVVLDNRKDEDPFYWLEHVKSLGENSPVMVVYNKADQERKENYSRKTLVERYPNIVAFYSVSCKTGFGIADFKAELKKHIAKDELGIKREYPNSYFNVKQFIEKEKSKGRHYISLEAYRAKCNEEGLTNKDAQDSWLRTLTSIGTVSFFDLPHTKHLQVLDPMWLTSAVYDIIISDHTKHRQGNITSKDFAQILARDKEHRFQYTEQHYPYMIALMKRYNLCYTDDDEHLLIPNGFAPEPPVEYSEFSGEDTTVYFFDYEAFLPTDIIRRFIARKLGMVVDRQYWFRGIVIHDRENKATAMVEMDESRRRIYCRIKGETPYKRDLFVLIREDIRQLNDTYAQLTCKERVLLDKLGDVWVDYDDLIGLLEMGEEKYVVAAIKRRFGIMELLGYFEQERESFFKLKKEIDSSVQKHNIGIVFDFNHHFNIHVIAEQSIGAVSNQLKKLQELDQEGKLEVDIQDFHEELETLLKPESKVETTLALVNIDGILDKIKKTGEFLYYVNGGREALEKLTNELGPQLIDIYRVSKGFIGSKFIGL